MASTYQRPASTKIVAVKNDPSAGLLAACDIPIDYLPVALYLMNKGYPTKYDEALSLLLRVPARVMALPSLVYNVRYDPMERAVAEERYVQPLYVCVDEIKRDFLELFDGLRKNKQVFKTDGTPVVFHSQIVRLSAGKDLAYIGELWHTGNEGKKNSPKIFPKSR